MKEKAITLIALVITIIILLILAGITISQLTNSGLFNNTKIAKEEYSNATAKEDDILKQYENAMTDGKITNVRENELNNNSESQTNLPNNILLKRDFQSASSAISTNTSKKVESIPLNNYGSGKAIINYSLEGKSAHTTYISGTIKVGNAVIAIESDSVPADAGWVDAACSLSAIIEYDENTVVDLYLYTYNSLTPYYGYSILLMPDA